MLKNKRGNVLSNVLIGAIVVFFIAIIFGTFYFSQEQDFISALGDSVDYVIKGIMTLFGPIFNILLGLEGIETSLAFLRVLAFILLGIVIVGTLDSVNI